MKRNRFIIVPTRERRSECILLGSDAHFAALDLVGHVAGRHSLDHAAHRRAGAQDLKDGALELTSKRLGALLASNIHNLIQRQVAVVLN